MLIIVIIWNVPSIVYYTSERNGCMNPSSESGLLWGFAPENGYGYCTCLGIWFMFKCFPFYWRLKVSLGLRTLLHFSPFPVFSSPNENLMSERNVHYFSIDLERQCMSALESADTWAGQCRGAWGGCASPAGKPQGGLQGGFYFSCLPLPAPVVLTEVSSFPSVMFRERNQHFQFRESRKEEWVGHWAQGKNNNGDDVALRRLAFGCWSPREGWTAAGRQSWFWSFCWINAANISDNIELAPDSQVWYSRELVPLCTCSFIHSLKKYMLKPSYSYIYMKLHN